MAAIASHFVVWFLDIVTEPRVRDQIGAPTKSKSICAAGSSLAFYGLDWARIAERTGRQIEVCTVPAASPCELESMCLGITNVQLTVVGVSSYDLNEHFLSDFRSATV